VQIAAVALGVGDFLFKITDDFVVLVFLRLLDVGLFDGLGGGECRHEQS